MNHKKKRNLKMKATGQDQEDMIHLEVVCRILDTQWGVSLMKIIDLDAL